MHLCLLKIGVVIKNVRIFELNSITNCFFFLLSGTITNRSTYQQFSGSVQVLKAVNDHLLLSFCQEGTATAPAQLYSVLFSRNPGTMPRWEIDSVHTLLQNKKLSVASRRMVCGNSADKPYGMVISILICLLAYAISTS